jgi:hypothetical protein
MPRSYGDKFLLELDKQTADSLGVELARLCVKANLPAAYVAVALETTPTTVYSWFRGQGIREKKRRIVEAFIKILQEDMSMARLPARSMFDAKAYMEEMLGVKI